MTLTLYASTTKTNFSPEQSVFLYRLPRETSMDQEMLLLNTQTGTVGRVANTEDGLPFLLGTITLAPRELAVFLPLFSSYPELCPFEELLAAYLHDTVTLERIEECRSLLEEAAEKQTWQDEILGIRTKFSCIRLKTHEIGLEIASVYETGYILQAVGMSYLYPFAPVENNTIVHCLRDILPPGHVLAYNRTNRLLSYLISEQGHHPCLFQEVALTIQEEHVFLPILTACPRYCPKDVLYASFHYEGRTETSSLERACYHLQEAEDAGQWDHAMRPIRNVLSRARRKMRTMGLAIVAVDKTGYMLSYVGPRLQAGRNWRSTQSGTL